MIFAKVSWFLALGYDFLARSSFIFRKDHEKCEFEVHEVFAVDVLISTGEGKVWRDF